VAVVLSPDARKQALRSLARFAEEQLELKLDDLQVMALLDFILKEIAPSGYNAGVADAQAYLRDRLVDLEGTCYEPEFAYWPKGSSVRRK
jgi:uncharacterized protein (DUF2164 family)